jgi:hypothetical protein
MRRRAVLSLTLLLLSSCATDRDIAAVESLDSNTGVTVRIVASPMVYAHEAPELAVNSRDYLSAGVVELINMDRRTQYLLLVAWTTVDRKRPGVRPLAAPDRISIAIAGRTREFSAPVRDPRALGVSAALLRPDTGYAGESWYRLSATDLKALAGDPPRRIDVLDDDTGTVGYALWRDESAAWRDFARDVPDASLSQDPRR